MDGVAGYVQLIEDGDAQAFRWGSTGKPHAFRTDAEIEKAFRGAVAEGLVRGEAHKLVGVERDVARKLSEGIGVHKDANDSIYVTWFLPLELATQLATLVPGGQAAGMHLTLLFLGDPDEDGSGPWDLDHISAVCKIFSMEWGKISGAVSGLGRFVGDGDYDFVIGLVDVPGLASFRSCLKERLLCSGCIPSNSPLYAEAHGFVPHITLSKPQAGVSTDLRLQERIEFEVDGFSLSYGAQHADYVFPDYPSMMDTSPEPYYASARTPASAENVAEANGEAPADALHYVVEKANEEQRYTLGPLYAPEREDAHGEGVDADTLQKAVWEYVRESSDTGRRLNLQHGELGDIQVGEWLEVMAWPYEHTITLKDADGTREVDMPAGTVYLGVQWDEAAWPLVKSGKLGGYSLGGKAVRVRSDVDWESMGGTEKAKPSKGTPKDRRLSENMYKAIEDVLDELKTHGDPDEAARQLADLAATRTPAPNSGSQILKLAAEAVSAAEEREKRALEGARTSAEKDRTDERTLVREAIEALKALATREDVPDTHLHVTPIDLQPHVHVHEGDTTIHPPVVNINEVPLGPDEDG